jgi:hypothetical protein
VWIANLVLKMRKKTPHAMPPRQWCGLQIWRPGPQTGSASAANPWLGE